MQVLQYKLYSTSPRIMSNHGFRDHKLTNEQRTFLADSLRHGGAQTVDDAKQISKGLSDLAIDDEARQLFRSLQLTQSTNESSQIIRRLLQKAGTNCDQNDADPYGDGDQSLVTTGEVHAQILRDIFARGGDLERWMREDAWSSASNKLSPFA